MVQPWKSGGLVVFWSANNSLLAYYGHVVFSCELRGLAVKFGGGGVCEISVKLVVKSGVDCRL